MIDDVTTVPSRRPSDRGRRGKGLVHRVRPTDVGQRGALLGAWAIVILVFSVASPATFPTAANWQNMLASQAVLLVLALGLSIPLRAGEFDLSVAAILGLTAMLIATLNVTAHWPIGAAVAVGILAGIVLGAINGVLIVGLGISSFIATLGSGTVMGGALEWISNSTTVTGVAPPLSNWVVGYRLAGVSLEFWYGTGLCVVIWYVFQHTAVGQRLLFVGRSPTVAELSGVNLGRVRWGAMVASGGIAALAGVILVGTQGGADPASGATFLLPAFAAVFLGATAIIPGRFNAWGTFVAVYFLVTGITGLQLLGVANFVQDLFYGTALIIAVAMSQIAQRRFGRRSKTD